SQTHTGTAFMKFQIETPAGLYTTPEGTARTLPHEWGPIYIIDHLFESSFVEGLAAVLSRLPFIASDYDTDETRHILHLKCELPAKTLMEVNLRDEALLALLPKAMGASHLSAVARITAAALAKFYPAYAGIEIGRIHVNCLPYGDLLNNHQDGLPGASLTGLYFGNAKWQADWQGELIMCDPGGESLYAIEPKPGRMVLFPGEIPHRAGAPSRACYAHRLSIGHKFRAVKSDT
ncbi:MAG: 2OG-Fe(II) oxygenase, partial [Lysobacterales bacterium]